MARALRPEERRLLAVLGLPALGMAFATTMVSTYLPVVARGFTRSTSVIGVIIVGEGLMALWVPLVAGSWSDRVRETGGSRLGFLARGLPVAAAALVGLGVVRSLPALGIIVTIFFGASFFAYEPYRAMYPDLVENEIAARAQGTQALWRGAGTFLALVSGGVLLSAARVLPFASAALLQALAIAALLILLPRISRRMRERPSAPGRAELGRALHEVTGDVRRLLREHGELREYLLANGLWELSLGALKSFVVLYVTVGLGQSLGSASLIIGAVALIIVVGALASGKAADRFGHIRAMQVGLWVYGLALAVLVFVHAPALIAVVAPFVAFGGGLTMTLPYALLQPLMPENEHGLLTAFYSFSRGLGVMLGPLLAGVAIGGLGGLFPSTHGYAAMWIVTSAAVLLSLPVLSRLRRRLDAREAAAVGARGIEHAEAGRATAAAKRARPRAIGQLLARVPAGARRAGRASASGLRRRVGGREQTRAVVLFACILGLSTVDLSSVGAMATEMKRGLHLHNTEFGLLAAIPSLAAAVVTLPLGVLADRVPRVRLLGIGVAVWAAAMALSGAVESYSQLLLARLALGAVTAVAGPVIASLTGDYFEPGERGRIYGLILSGELLGTGVGYLVSGNIAAVLSWRASFYLLAVPAGVLSVLVLRLLREPARGSAGRSSDTAASSDQRDPAIAAAVAAQQVRPRPDLIMRGRRGRLPLWEAVRYVLRVRTNVALIVSSALGYFFSAGVQTFGSLFVHLHFGISQALATTLLTLVGAGALVRRCRGGAPLRSVSCAAAISAGASPSPAPPT